MSTKNLLNNLEELAAQLDIDVRYERTTARGGLCRHMGEYKVIIDSKATDEFKIELLVEAIKAFDLTDMYISPQIRDLL